MIRYMLYCFLRSTKIILEILLLITKYVFCVIENYENAYLFNIKLIHVSAV